VVAISPALLLAIVLAAASASLYSLLTRVSWALLPLCWLLGVAGFVAGQALGAAWDRQYLMIGQLHVGLGLAMNGLLLLGLHTLRVWYNRRHEPRGS
jgi:hypothetical protein